MLIILQFCVKEALVHVSHNRALNSLRAGSLGWGAATESWQEEWGEEKCSWPDSSRQLRYPNK